MRTKNQTCSYILTRNFIIIGIVEDISGMNDERHFAPAPGDDLLLYTDGITEMELMGDLSRMYGFDRLLQQYQAHGHKSPAEVPDAILADAAGFKNDDDITLFALWRK